MSYSQTKLLIHFNGTNGATTHTAETGQTVTFAGDAKLSTSEKKFGTASLALDGNGDYVTVPDSDDWYFGADPFTIDLWVNIHGMHYTVTYQNFVGQIDGGNYWRFYRAAEHLHFIILYNSSTLCYVTAPWIPTLDTWYHLEFVRSGTDIYIFSNGVSLSVTQNTPISTKAVPNLSAALEIGSLNGDGKLNGWIDEVRISKGIARHTENFTTPSAEYATPYTVSSNVSGTWKNMTNIYTKVSGSWKEVNGVYTKVSGSWKQL